MESYREVCATREQLRKAAALALAMHFSRTHNPAPFMDILKRFYTAEEFDGLEIMASVLPSPEKETLEQFCSYARLAWNLEVAEAARIHLNSATAEEVANAPW